MAKFHLCSHLFVFIFTFYSSTSKVLTNKNEERFLNSTNSYLNTPNEICPGGGQSCPDDFTCCSVEAEQYACCPLPNAVCCSDGLHCCPDGTTCDMAHGKCIKGSENTKSIELLFTKVKYEKATNKIFEDISVVVCPGGEYQCPDENTCCMLSSGQWGCCPLPNAVCCEDKIHCCPSGETCGQGRCESSTASTPMARKTTATPVPRRRVRNVVCPGGEYECPDDNTCCKLQSGEWGCCPLPDAVCCDDEVHCCPSGTTCDEGECTSGPNSTPWSTKFEASVLPVL